MVHTHRPASQGPRVTSAPYGRYNVVAHFPNMVAAREAIQALGYTGIDGERISLTGPAAEEAAARPESREAEPRLLFRQFGVGVAGSLVGAVVGAVIGLIIGFFALPEVDADRSVPNLLLCAAFGAFTGSIPGALIAYFGSLQPNQPWMLTFQQPAGRGLFVGVHTHDRNEFRRAEEQLRSHSPRVRSFDNAGQSIG